MCTSNIENISQLFTYFSSIEDKLKSVFLRSTNIVIADIILLAKNIKKKNAEKWDKESASRFGKLLKFLKIRTIVENNWEENFKNNYSYINKFTYLLKEIKYNHDRRAGVVDIKDDKSNYSISIKIYKILNNELLNQTQTIETNIVKHIYGDEEGHIFIILSDNNVICKGNNTFGQLGIGNYNIYNVWIDFTNSNLEISNNLKKICIGYAYSFFITNTGCVYATGAGENGRLGSGSNNNICIPKKIDISDKIIDIACGSTHACFLTINNEVYTSGQRSYNGYSTDSDCLIPVKLNLKNIINVQIGIGGYHTFCLTKSGTLKAWGHNRVGQLGISCTKIFETVCKTKYISKENSVQLLSELEDEDPININPEFTIVTKPIDIYFPKSIVKIAIGWGHTMILTMDKELYICGRNNEFQLGITPSKFEFKRSTHNTSRIYIDRFVKVDLENVTDIITYQNINYIKANGKLWTFGSIKIIDMDIRVLNKLTIKEIELNGISIDDIIFNRNNIIPTYVLICK